MTETDDESVLRSVCQGLSSIYGGVWESRMSAKRDAFGNRCAMVWSVKRWRQSDWSRDWAAMVGAEKSGDPFEALHAMLPRGTRHPHVFACLEHVQSQAPLHLLVVHLPSRGKPVHADDRVRVMAEIGRIWRAYVRGTGAETPPRFLVVGDFNDEPWSSSVSVSTSRSVCTRRTEALHPILADLEKGRQFVGTWRPRSDDPVALGFEVRWYTLDGVLASRALRQGVADGGLGLGKVEVLNWDGPSDHLPIAVGILIP
jgi:endonuclease/exonuclease/phosphatase family metal-dependent hydrolase